MQPSINAARLIASHAETFVALFEGLVLKTYFDQNKVLTCCFGHTGAELRIGQTWTREQCILLLHNDLKTADLDVCRLVTVPLNQNEFDALVSFDYNVGSGHLRDSTTLALLNQGNRLGAANAMLAWSKTGGKNNPGLLRRRTAERALFLKAA